MRAAQPHRARLVLRTEQMKGKKLFGVFSRGHPDVNDLVVFPRAGSAAERVAVADRDGRAITEADETPSILAHRGLLTQTARRPESTFHYLPREVFFGRFAFPFPAGPSVVFGCDFAGFLLGIMAPSIVVSDPDPATNRISATGPPQRVCRYPQPSHRDRPREVPRRTGHPPWTLSTLLS